MICSLRLGSLIFALFGLLRAQSNCFGHGTNARFEPNARFRPSVICDPRRSTAAGFADPAAAPLGATNPRYRSALTRPENFKLRRPGARRFRAAA